MSTKIAASDAKAHFADCLRSAEKGETVVITRHGKAVAAIVPPDVLAQIERLRAAGPQAGLAGLAGGWEGSEELADILDKIRRSPPRRVPRLD